MSTNETEQKSCEVIGDAFRSAFHDVSVQCNAVIALPSGFRNPTGEIDCVVVCNAGVFLFEIKGWKNTCVSREAVVGLEAKQWFLNSIVDGKFVKTPVRDPIAQGFEKQTEIRRHLDARIPLRSLVFLGGPNVVLHPQLPSAVVAAPDLPYFLRTVRSERKRDSKKTLDADGVALVSRLITGLSTGLTVEDHVRFIQQRKNSAIQAELSAQPA